MSAASTPVIDTHRHPFGRGAKRLFSAVGAYDPHRPLPQAARGNVFYAEWLDEETTVAGQREGGVTRALLSNGGELELLSQLAGGDQEVTLRMLLEDKLELIERHPDDFDLMADANPFDEACRPLVDEALDHHGAKAISVATSWGDGAERRFLDDPACEWLWELSLERDVAVHLHPPMMPVGQEVQLPYRLMEVVGRPCDTALTVARMICAGTYQGHPRCQPRRLRVAAHPHRAVPCARRPGVGQAGAAADAPGRHLRAGAPQAGPHDAARARRQGRAISSSAGSGRPLRTCCGWPTSPACARGRAGSTSPRSRTPTVGRSSAGAWPTICAPSWSSTRSRWPSRAAGPTRGWSIAAIGAALYVSLAFGRPPATRDRPLDGPQGRPL